MRDPAPTRRVSEGCPRLRVGLVQQDCARSYSLMTYVALLLPGQEGIKASRTRAFQSAPDNLLHARQPAHHDADHAKFAPQTVSGIPAFQLSHLLQGSDDGKRIDDRIPGTKDRFTVKPGRLDACQVFLEGIGIFSSRQSVHRMIAERLASCSSLTTCSRQARKTPPGLSDAQHFARSIFRSPI